MERMELSETRWDQEAVQSLFDPNTNYNYPSPSALLCTPFLVMLEADRTRAADLEVQILELERSLSALRNEKVLVQERLDSYKYPVLTLPNEIVSEIFIHFLPVYPLCPPLAGILSPTSLTQICRKWRDIALATPALWRAIRLSDYHIPSEPRRVIFDLWLNRSRCCPLSVHIDEYNEWLHVPGTFSDVISHSTRWEYMKLHLLGPSVPATERPMPLLRHLDLALDVPCVWTFPDMPLLRTVVLDDVAAANVVLPWAQLTSLTLRYVYPEECAPILQRSSNLVHCDLEVWISDDESQPDITLPCLESLTLRSTNDDPVIGYLNTLIVPTLRSLEVPERFLGTNPIDSLKSFVSKSGCKLQEVWITGKRNVPEHSFRQAFPLVQRFSFGRRYHREIGDD
ncbi:hypothetical protein B0H13DRAFT_2472959 [Mycena leptocephala]|nr:hypothetical protein B0H13DRAFT_2472959 [Mycena leptocephala]